MDNGGLFNATRTLPLLPEVRGGRVRSTAFLGPDPLALLFVDYPYISWYLGITADGW